MAKIIVVGGGVIGLTAAYQLVQEGHHVEIISQDFPSTGLLKPEYTSSKSGAHFRPFPSKSNAEYRDSKLARSTYRAFKKLARDHPESSIKWIKGTDYLEKPDPLYLSLARGYTEEIEDFEVIPQSQLPEGVAFGANYKTWVINSPLYLDFLERRLVFGYGVKLTTATVRSLKEVAQLYPDSTIVNATGMGLQWDGSWDQESYPIRGQTLLVRAPLGSRYLDHTITYQMANGQWSFVIPRPLDGGIIVGGTKVLNSLDPSPSDAETRDLINNAAERFPDLLIAGQFDIRRVNVGFRPARNGGVHIGAKVVDGHKIVDCYGFGGSGMEFSWGAAEKVVALVNDTKARL